MPTIRSECDGPCVTHPRHCLPNGKTFALQEVISQEKAGSVFAGGAVDQHGDALADALVGERKCRGKPLKTVLEIAVEWRCIARKRNARIGKPLAREVFGMAKLAVVDRQDCAKPRFPQMPERPRLFVRSATSGQQVWHKPEDVIHPKGGVRQPACRCDDRPVEVMYRRVRLAELGRADTGNGSEHNQGTGIELQWLAYCTRWRFSREVLSEDFVEPLNQLDVEKIQLHKQHVGIASPASRSNAPRFRMA